MKRVISAFTAIALIVCLMTGCSMLDSLTKSNYVKGTFDNKGYKSEFLNLQFTAPDGFTMMDQKTLDEYLAEEDESALNSVTYEMGCENPDGVNAFVVCERVQKILKIEKYVDNFIQGYKDETTEYKSSVSDSKDEFFADETWKLVTVTSELPSNGSTVKVLQDFYFKKIEDRVVTVMITYYDGFSTRELVNSFETIK